MTNHKLTTPTSAGLLADEICKLRARQTVGEYGQGWHDALNAVERVRQSAAPASEAGEVIHSLLTYFETLEAADPNEHPHYPNGVRPFSTGDVRHYAKVLRALSHPSESAEAVELLRECADAADAMIRALNDQTSVMTARKYNEAGKRLQAARARIDDTLAKLDAQGGAGDD